MNPIEILNMLRPGSVVVFDEPIQVGNNPPTHALTVAHIAPLIFHAVGSHPYSATDYFIARETITHICAVYANEHDFHRVQRIGMG